MQLLITRIIPLNPKDLETWVVDPEEWVNSEEKDDEQWEFEIRVSVLNVSTPSLTDCYESLVENVF